MKRKGLRCLFSIILYVFEETSEQELQSRHEGRFNSEFYENEKNLGYMDQKKNYLKILLTL